MEYDSLFILFHSCAGKWIWFRLLEPPTHMAKLSVACSYGFMWRLSCVSLKTVVFVLWGFVSYLGGALSTTQIVLLVKELNRCSDKFCVYWPLRVVVLEVLVWQHWRHFVHPLWEMRHKMVKLFLPQFLVFYTSPLVSVSARPVNEIRYIFL